MEGKTVIAIAHRLSTIARMDRLIVLEEGRIVEEGSQDELLKLGGHYERLWRHQSGGFLAPDVALPGRGTSGKIDGFPEIEPLVIGARVEPLPESGTDDAPVVTRS